MILSSSTNVLLYNAQNSVIRLIPSPDSAKTDLDNKGLRVFYLFIFLWFFLVFSIQTFQFDRSCVGRNEKKLVLFALYTERLKREPNKII